MRTIVHLTASAFFGGPERQMCGLAQSLPGDYRTIFILFAENGGCQAFLEEARRRGFEALALAHDTPFLHAAVRELESHLQRARADVLCCHGYKADLIGRPAARRQGIPAVAVSRGWTGANLKLRVYEAVDRLSMRWMDRVVCVSEGQAVKVRRAGVPPGKVLVIRNAIRSERFDYTDPAFRDRLQAFFPEPRSCIVGAAGRLSREKGFDNLIRAAQPLVQADPSLGFVLFGDGRLRHKLTSQINAAGLARQFVLAGFRTDLDGFLPFLDLLVLPSYTEGLPNVVLEAFAAGIPVVATAVGGTPEVIEEGSNGYLVPPGDVAALTDRIGHLLASADRRRTMGRRARQRVREHFSFEVQSGQYQRFFDHLIPAPEKLLVCD